MTEIASLSAAWSIPAPPARAESAAPKPGQNGVDTEAAHARVDATRSDFPKESKVKTEQSSAFSFTYTFYDAKTLEIIDRWPQTPTYKLAPREQAAGATLQAVI